MRGLPSGASELRSRRRSLLFPGRHRCVKFDRLSVTVRREVRHTLCGGEKKELRNLRVLNKQKDSWLIDKVSRHGPCCCCRGHTTAHYSRPLSQTTPGAL